MALLVAVRLLVTAAAAASRKSQVIERALVEASRGSTIDADRSRLFRPARAPAGARAADLSRPARDLARRSAVRRRRADGSDPDLHVRQPRQFSAAGGAVLRARRRDHGAGRHRAARGRLGDVDDRRRARLARGDDGRGLRAVRRDGAHFGRHRRGGRPA